MISADILIEMAESLSSRSLKALLIFLQQFSVRKSFNLKTIVGSHASVQSFHRLKNDGIEEIAQRGPELGLGPESFPQEAEEPTAPLLDLFYCNGEKHEQGQHRRQGLHTVPVVMLEMVTLILERVEGFVFDLPAAPPSSHYFLYGARFQRQTGNPGPACDFPFLVGLLVKEVVDIDLDRTVGQAQIIGPGKVMF